MSAVFRSSLFTTPDARQSGAGLAEFSIVVLPLLTLGLGSVELSHWFYTRQAVSMALLDAGRAAITDHNRSASIITSFEASLKPMYPAPRSADTVQRLHQALSARQIRMHGAPWQIEVLSPSASAYRDFSDPGLRVDGAAGRPAINNHYLLEQNDHNLEKGWPEGRGPVSGQTIYEANTVALRLSWLHQPRLPLIRPVLRALGNPQGNYRQRGLAQGYLPMTRQITLLMQSHPVHWPDDSSQKIIYRAENDVSDLNCRSGLCDRAQIDPVAVQNGAGPDPTTASSTAPGSDSPTPHRVTPDVSHDPIYGDGSDSTVPVAGPNDPACGVVLCCG